MFGFGLRENWSIAPHFSWVPPVALQPPTQAKTWKSRRGGGVKNQLRYLLFTPHLGRRGVELQWWGVKLQRVGGWTSIPEMFTFYPPPSNFCIASDKLNYHPPVGGGQTTIPQTQYKFRKVGGKKSMFPSPIVNINFPVWFWYVSSICLWSSITRVLEV